MTHLPAFFIFLFSLFSSDAYGADLELSLSSPNVDTGQQFSVSIRVAEAKDLFSAPFYLVYDPQYLEFIKIQEGDFLKRDGNSTAFLHNNRKSGRIIIGLSRLGTPFGVSGSGVLAAISFKALKPGEAVLRIDNAKFKNSRLAPVAISAQKAIVEIRDHDQ